MIKDFNKYMIQVREQLECNATEEHKKEYTVYLYSNEQIDDNLDYFENCMNKHFSAYLALLYFRDYLDGELEFND